MFTEVRRTLPRLRAATCRAGREPRSPDDGASTIQLVMLAPLVILCILLIGQFAMVYDARHAAVAAAQAGARAGEEAGQGQYWQSEATTTAMSMMHQLAGSLLSNEEATPVGGGSQRGVEVTGTALSLVPGLTFHVQETSVGPTECFRTAGTGQCAGG